MTRMPFAEAERTVIAAFARGSMSEGGAAICWTNTES